METDLTFGQTKTQIIASAQFVYQFFHSKKQHHQKVSLKISTKDQAKRIKRQLKMTKLGEWLFGLSIFFAVYFALITKQLKHQIIDDYLFEIQILPAVLIILLGVSYDDVT
jgi:predicted membrane protein